MSSSKKITKPSREELLKEYELCQDSVQYLESTIWKTSAAIGIGAIGPLLIFIGQNKNPDYSNASIVGLLIFIAVLIWWKMALRWWDIQHTTFLRMRHIEEDLDLFQKRYTDFRDGKFNVADSNLSRERKKELKYDIKFRRRGTQKYMKLFPGLYILPGYCIY